MLTAEDIEAHQRLLGQAADTGLTELVEAYRAARRGYEARRWSGQDADEARARCHILASLLADRLAFGSEAEPSGDHEGSSA